MSETTEGNCNFHKCLLCGEIDKPVALSSPMLDRLSLLDDKDHESLILEAIEMLDGADMEGLERQLRESLRRYLRFHVRTGGFLMACLENNFSRAVALAHPALTLTQLKLVQQLLDGGFPCYSWGSKEAVEAWLVGTTGTE